MPVLVCDECKALFQRPRCAVNDGYNFCSLQCCKDNWANRKPVAGVYAILQVRSGLAYIGSSKNIAARYRSHRCMLRAGTHTNLALQHDWKKHGEQAFKLCVIEVMDEECSKEELFEAEQTWMDHFKTSKVEFGYNMLPKAASREGFKHSKATRKKIAASNMGRRHSEATLNKMRMHRGDARSSAKLTSADVFEIKRRLAAGERQKEIAEDFGVSRQTIGSIATGTNWSHLN